VDGKMVIKNSAAEKAVETTSQSLYNAFRMAVRVGAAVSVGRASRQAGSATGVGF
jgi:hypothetical protein